METPCSIIQTLNVTFNQFTLTQHSRRPFIARFAIRTYQTPKLQVFTANVPMVCQNRTLTFHKALPQLCLALTSMQVPHQMPQVKLLRALGIVVHLGVHVRINLHPLNNPFWRPLSCNPRRQVTKKPMTNSRWALLNNPNYKVMLIIHVPLMIRLINLNQTQAPYLALYVNVTTFLLHTQLDLHKRLVLPQVLLPRQLV